MIQHKYRKLALAATVVVLILIGSFYLSEFVINSDKAQEVLASYGYLGVVLIGLVGGLNVLAPFPPATFSPVFTSAGLHLPLVVLMFAVGTTLADLLGYLFGKVSKNLALEKYPKTFAYISDLHENKRKWLIPFIFIYAMVIPLPNEAFLIPLAIIGVPLRSFLLPMLIGTFIYHAVVAYGVDFLFGLFV